ncbi:hypothetical protein HYH03_017998 [Edaphochlamys debaryana]|uniref:Uncharacterized protein n=1 Tax=Edaphochlamys debaryana TaxID=47281 RepID=A0A835XGS8_9CHLO|nr:hypothetical protein HYH03_017998 [Edaphochlamys debaryana]|eukprot:KAG2483104.1 hypothetical protein HYH03_017998 [Edaphochlamys debaryana]
MREPGPAPSAGTGAGSRAGAGPAAALFADIFAPPAWAAPSHLLGSSQSPAPAQPSTAAGDPFLPGPPFPPRMSVGSSWGGDVGAGRPLGASWPGPEAGGGAPDPAEEARRARRRHRKRVASIVVAQWKVFAAERLRAVAARRHQERRLLTAALVAWQVQAGAGRARLRQAAVFDLKRSVLRVGRCLQAWHDVARRSAALRALLEQGVVDRQLRVARKVVRAWHGRCLYAAEKRRRQLQAWYYWCFAALSRAIRGWHAWLQRRRAKATRLARADAHASAARKRRVFAAWRQRRSALAWKAAAGAKAEAFRHRWARVGVLRRWRVAAKAGRTARVAACVALAEVASRMEASQAVACLRAWQAHVTDKRRRQQRERYAAAFLRRWRQLMVLWAWRQERARRAHLRHCGQVVAAVGRRVRLGLALSRWLLAVELLQGQRTAELRAAVLVRAAWGAWRAYVEHCATKRELTRVASRRVACVVLAAALAEWRSRAAHWAAKAAAWARAAAWHRRRALGRLLPAWRGETARLAAKGAKLGAAKEHRWRVVAAAVMRRWRRYAWHRRMKAVAAERRPSRLARGSLRAWLGHTRYKAAKELARRRAVRHRYLALLRAGLGAFRAAVERRAAKQAFWAQLARLHPLFLARTLLLAWRHTLLPQGAAKRAARRRAEAHRRSALAARAWAAWRDEAARRAAKHVRLRHASGHAALRLLRRVLRAWAGAGQLVEARRAAKAGALAAARQALAHAARGRLLAAWREVHAELVVKRIQVARALACRRLRLLSSGLTAWALHLAARRAKRLLDARARAARRLRLWRGCIAALAEHAAAARAARRAQAVAVRQCEGSLLRRGFAALVWYGRYRAAKERGYVSARAQYVRRLQREGAAMWLEVGLARRQERIQGLAAAQASDGHARALARDLARVEPFARRWLHTVRQRRRERLGLAPGAYLPGAASQSYLSYTSFGAGAAAGRDRDGLGRRGAGLGHHDAGPLPSTRQKFQPQSLWSSPDPVFGPGLTMATGPGPQPGAARQLGGYGGTGAGAFGSSSAGTIPAGRSTVRPAPALQLSPQQRPPPRTPPSLRSGLGPWPAQRRSPPGRFRGGGGGIGTGQVPTALGRGVPEAPGVPARARPQPRCPDFLLRRPATVGPVPSAGVGSGHGGPSYAAAPAPATSGGGRGLAWAQGSSTATGGYQAWAGPSEAPGQWKAQGSVRSGEEVEGPVELTLRPHTTAAATAHSSGGGSAGWSSADGGRGSSGGGGGGGSVASSLGGWGPGHAPAPLFFSNLPLHHAPPAAQTAAPPPPRHPAAAPAPAPSAPLPPPSSSPSRTAPRHPALTTNSPAVPAPSPPAPDITLHRPGPRPPDVLRLPTRGGNEGSPASAGRRSDDGDGAHSAWNGPTAAPASQPLAAPAAAGARSGAAAAPRASPTHPALRVVGARHAPAPPAPVPMPADLVGGGTGGIVGGSGRGAGSEMGAAASAGSSGRATAVRSAGGREGSQAGRGAEGSGAGAAGEGAAGELEEVERVLVYCKGLKDLLRQLEGDEGAEGGRAGGDGGAGGGDGEGRRQQAAQVREALAALRPAVEAAAARLRQIRGLALKLLRVFEEASTSSPRPLPTTELRAPAYALAKAAEAIAQAFPNLTCLKLTVAERLSIGTSRDVQSLLGSRTEPALLPSLKELSLTPAPGSAPPRSPRQAPFTACLEGATQLTSLSLGFNVQPDELPLLGALTGLRRLQLGDCDKAPQPLVNLQALAALRSLADLEAPSAMLDVSALQGLSRLTRLHLLFLENTGPVVWRLPPLLQDLHLRAQPAHVLCGLRGSPVRALQRNDVNLILFAGLHVSEDEGWLLPAGEDALCGALEALTGRLDNEAALSVTIAVGKPLLPVGGEAGPEQRNHTRWLRALGRLSVRQLLLAGVALSHQDMAALVEACASLQKLILVACAFSASSLPQLAQLPLESLALDLSSWRRSEAGSIRIPSDAQGSLLALLCSPGFMGSVSLRVPDSMRVKNRRRIERLVQAIRSELEAQHLNPTRLRWY